MLGPMELDVAELTPGRPLSPAVVTNKMPWTKGYFAFARRIVGQPL